MSDSNEEIEDVCGLSVDEILTLAYKKKLTSVMVIGYDEDGNFYANSSSDDGRDILWMLKRAETAIMDAALGYDEDEEDQDDEQ